MTHALPDVMRWGRADMGLDCRAAFRIVEELEGGAPSSPAQNTVGPPLQRC
jgi:hypothetical protein